MKYHNVTLIYQLERTVRIENQFSKFSISLGNKLNIGKKQLKFLDHIMTKDGLENLRLKGHTEGKHEVNGKQRIANLTRLCKWLTE